MINELYLSTTKEQVVIDITNELQDIVKKSEVVDGLCIIQAMHTTCGLFINENYDKNVGLDLVETLERIAPKKSKYHHNIIDNNAHAHVKSSFIQPSITLIISKNELVLGKWQSIALAEFDGPKKRKLSVKIIKS